MKTFRLRNVKRNQTVIVQIMLEFCFFSSQAVKKNQTRQRRAAKICASFSVSEHCFMLRSKDPMSQRLSTKTSFHFFASLTQMKFKINRVQDRELFISLLALFLLYFYVRPLLRSDVTKAKTQFFTAEGLCLVQATVYLHTLLCKI